MKIAFLNIYNGKVERGSEVFVDKIAEKLSLNHDVTVFQIGNPQKKSYRIRQIKNIPFSLYKFHHLRVFLFTLKVFPTLWREKFDWIIPINGRSQVILIRLLRFLRGGKILVSGHAGVGFDDRFNLLAGKPDVFVTITPLAYAWARSFHQKMKIILIPNGVDTETFHPNIKPARVGLRSPMVLCVSALQEYKQIPLLIDAVAKLDQVSLLVIGDGPQKEHIAQFGQKALGNKFQHIKHIPHSELASWYRVSDIFSLPSRVSEAFGLVYLEAMACNKAVVAPDDENRRSIIGEAGIYCDVLDTKSYAKALAQALETSWEDKPRKQAEKFSWENIAKLYEDILEKT